MEVSIGQTWNGLEIDMDRRADEGICIIKGCASKLNPEPCCFCSEHCQVHRVVGGFSVNIEVPNAQPPQE